MLVLCYDTIIRRKGTACIGSPLASWSEFIDKFGTSSWRVRLATGKRASIEYLKSAGCQTVYVNGSFVTAKEVPNDFDTSC